MAAPRRGLTDRADRLAARLIGLLPGRADAGVAAGHSGGHVWQRGFLLWDGFFALAHAVTIGAIAVDRGGTTGGRWVAVAAVLGCAVWYVVFGRPLMRADDESWRGLVYCGVSAVLLLLALVFSPAASFALVFLIPQAYWCLATGPATVVVVTYCSAVVLMDALRSADPTGQLAGEAPIMLLLVAFAVVVGGWAHRIIRQSRDRAELIEQLESTRAQLAAMSRDAGIVAERQRLSAEIHDTLAQGFTSIVMLVQAADSALEALPASPRVDQARRHLDSAARTARENLAEARAMVGALRPAALESASVSDAVNRLVTRFGQDRDVAASYIQHGEAVRLDPATEVVLLRAAQEALTNVGKHADPSSVEVSLRFTPERVVLSVCDDGSGFDPGQPSGGYGLTGMRTRIEQIGGTCTITSEAGAGTTVTAEVPR
ncbi:MAG TPA: sensor histidine kinase [Pseudonocardiaceae bacterium]